MILQKPPTNSNSNVTIKCKYSKIAHINYKMKLDISRQTEKVKRIKPSNPFEFVPVFFFEDGSE